MAARGSQHNNNGGKNVIDISTHSTASTTSFQSRKDGNGNAVRRPSSGGGEILVRCHVLVNVLRDEGRVAVEERHRAEEKTDLSTRLAIQHRYRRWETTMKQHRQR